MKFLFAVAGVLVVAAAVAMARAPDDTRAVLIALGIGAAGYVTALIVLCRVPRLSAGMAVFAVCVTVLARAALVTAAPVHEDDVYRYLWDGAVLASGESPYRFSPQQVHDRRLDRPLPELDAAEALRLERLAALSRAPALEPAFLRINYPSVRTIYPPAAQLIFAAVAASAPGSVTAMKLVLVGLEGVLIVLVVLLLGALGIDRRWVIVYAWSPLAVVSFAGAAHMDIIPMVAFTAALVLALRGRQAAAGVALGVAVAAKLFPLLAWPALRRHLGWRGTAAAGLTAGALYGPFLLEGHVFDGLRTFARLWTSNAAGFALFELVAGAETGRALAGLTVVAITVGSAWRVRGDRTAVAAATWAVAALVLLSPAVNPWYVAWLLPLAAALRSVPLTALTLTCLLYYATFLPGDLEPWLRLAAYGTPAALAALAVVRPAALAIPVTFRHARHTNPERTPGPGRGPHPGE